MGVPTSEVGYAPAMTRREDHEVHKGHVVALGGDKKNTTNRSKYVTNFEIFGKDGKNQNYLTTKLKRAEETRRIMASLRVVTSSPRWGGKIITIMSN